MYLVCCDGTIEQTTFTAGMTAAQRQAAISALVGRCLMKDAFCGGTDTFPNPGDGTNGTHPGNDPNDPLQLYGNRPMSSTSYCADGSPFTYTVPAGLFFARTQSAADTAALNFARTLSSSLKICLTGPLRTCCNNVAYSSTMVASGGVPGDFRWSVIGSLPAGLVAIPVGRNGLRIQGIPTTNGNYTFTVRATDAAGNFMAKVITIKVWGIADATLPDGALAADYDYQLTTTNGTAPYIYTLVSGGFPLGVDITSTGLITGVVGEEGAFDSVIRVTDSAGRTCTKSFTLTVPIAARWVHWPFEALDSGKLTDCISGVQEPFYVHVVPSRTEYAFVPGRVNNALHFFDGVGSVQVAMGIPATGLASLKHDGNGFSLCCWIYINNTGDPNPVATDVGSVAYYGDALVGNGEVRFWFNGTNTKFVARDQIHNETINIALPSTGAWHFLHMFQDKVAGKMGIQWDMGAITYASFSVFQGPSTTGLVQVYENSGGWISNDWIVDELSVRLDACFTPAQLTYLYNSGAGRTCPMTLP